MESVNSRGESCSSRSGPGHPNYVDSSDVQSKYWVYLFGSFERSMDQLYHSCEMNENLVQCKEAILMLENYTRNFHNLAEWLRIKWEYENTPYPQKQNYIAWEIRKPWKAHSSCHRNSKNTDSSSKSSNNIIKQVDNQGYKSGRNVSRRVTDGTVDCGISYDAPPYHHSIIVDPSIGGHLYQTSIPNGTNISAAVYIPPGTYPELYMERPVHDSQTKCNHVTNRHDHLKKHSFSTLPEKNTHTQSDNFDSAYVNQSQTDVHPRNEHFLKSFGTRSEKKSSHQSFHIRSQRKKSKQCPKPDFNINLTTSTSNKSNIDKHEINSISCGLSEYMAVKVDFLENYFTETFSKCEIILSKESPVMNQENPEYVDFAIAKLDAVEEKILNSCFQTNENQKSHSKFEISVACSSSNDNVKVENLVVSTNENPAQPDIQSNPKSIMHDADLLLRSNSSDNSDELLNCPDKISIPLTFNANEECNQDNGIRDSDNAILLIEEPKFSINRENDILMFNENHCQVLPTTENKSHETMIDKFIPNIETNLKSDSELNVILKRDSISGTGNPHDTNVADQNVTNKNEKLTLKASTCSVALNPLSEMNHGALISGNDDIENQNDISKKMEWKLNTFKVRESNSNKDFKRNTSTAPFSSQHAWKAHDMKRNPEEKGAKFLFSLTETERMMHFPELGSSSAYKKSKNSSEISKQNELQNSSPCEVPRQGQLCVQQINFAKIVGSASTKKYDSPKITEDDMKEKDKPRNTSKFKSFSQDSNETVRLRFPVVLSVQEEKHNETRDEDGWERVKSKTRWKDDSAVHFKRDLKNVPIDISSISCKAKPDSRINQVKSNLNLPVYPQIINSTIPLHSQVRPTKPQGRAYRNQKSKPLTMEPQREHMFFEKLRGPSPVEKEAGGLPLSLCNGIISNSGNQNDYSFNKDDIFVEDKKTECYIHNTIIEGQSNGMLSEFILSSDVETNSGEATSCFHVGNTEEFSITNPSCTSPKHMTKCKDCKINSFSYVDTSANKGIITKGDPFYSLQDNKNEMQSETQEKKLNSEMRSEMDLEEIRINEEEIRINEEEIRKSNELHEEELMLTRKIQDLQLADLDDILDTETDEIDVDCDSEQSVEVDPSQIHQAYNQYLQSIPWSDQIDEMEKLANIIGTNKDTSYEPASLEQFKELVARHPRRALELHLKLSRRSKREGSEEKNVARRQKADEKRQQLLSDKAAKMRELVQKVEEVKAQQNLIAQERKYRLDLKLKKAEENRNQHLSIIRRKAHDEEEKLKEIAFINELEAQNRRHESMALRQEQEERLQNIIEERQRKVGEKAAKEAAVEERRRVLEAERQEKLEKMQEKRRKKEEIIGRKQLEKRKERLVIAREKAREREERLQARQAAQLATAEELQKKIQQKQESSARRHEENIELIRQKALETGTLRSLAADDDSPHFSLIKHVAFDDARKCETESEIIDNDKKKLMQRKRMKKLRSRMNSRGAKFLQSHEFKSFESCSEFITYALKELEALSFKNPAIWNDLDTAAQLDKCLSEVHEILQKKTGCDLIVIREYKGFYLLSKFFGVDEVTGKDRSTELSVRCFIKVCSIYELACGNSLENAKYMIHSNNISLLCDSLRCRLNNFLSKSKTGNIGILLNTLKAILSPLTGAKEEQMEIQIKLNDFISYTVCSGLINRISDLIHYISVNDGEIYFDLLTPALEFLCALTELSIKNEEYLEVLRSTDLMGTISLLYGVLQAKPKSLPSFTSEALKFLLAIACLDINLFQEVLGAEGVCLQFRHTAKFLLKFCSKEEKLENVLHYIIQIIGFFAVHNINNQEILVSGNLPTVISQLLALPFQYYSEPLLHQILFPTLIACCYDNETNNAIVRDEMNVNLLDDFLIKETSRKSRVIQHFLHLDDVLTKQ